MKPENYDDIEEIDLVEVFYAVLARWSVILLATVVLATLGYCYGRFLVTPQYASTSALYVLSKSTSIIKKKYPSQMRRIHVSLPFPEGIKISNVRRQSPMK